MAKAKFQCQSVKDNGYTKEVELQAVYGTGNPEDNEFSKATPSGRLVMTISNPVLNEFFIPTQNYYLDITPVPEA